MYYPGYIKYVYLYYIHTILCAQSSYDLEMYH